MRARAVLLILGITLVTVSCSAGGQKKFNGRADRSPTRDDIQKSLDEQYQANPGMMKQQLDGYLDRTRSENYQMMIESIEKSIGNETVSFDGFTFDNLLDKLRDARDDLDVLGDEAKTTREIYEDLGLDPYDRTLFSTHSSTVHEAMQQAEEVLSKGSSAFELTSAKSRSGFLGLERGRAGVNCRVTGNMQDSSAIAAGTCGATVVLTCPVSALIVSVPACVGSAICTAAAGVTQVGASIASLVGDCSGDDPVEPEPETEIHVCPKGETYDLQSQKCVKSV